MKATTTLLLVGGLAYMGFRAKQAAEQVALAIAANTVQPPPNSGPVVNGLSFYQLEGLGGFGSSFKKAVKKTTSSVKKLADNKITKVPLAIATGGASLATSKVIGTVTKKSPLFKTVSKSPDKTPAASNQEVIYQDVNGTPISLTQYNAIISAMQSGNPIPTVGGWALPAGYIVLTKPEVLTPVYQSPGIITPSINQGTAPVQYNAQPNEELIINSSQDSDYGLPGTQYTADSSGSPGLPGGVTTEVSTPAAQEATPMAAPESNTGKLLMGTGIAAVAAYLAFS